MRQDSFAKLASWLPFQAVGLPTSASLKGDLAAGLTLAAIAVPEQMATARLGGFSPMTGLYAFVAAGLAFAAFGSSRRLSAGADSTITPIFVGGLTGLALAGAGGFGGAASLLALMVGVLVALAGLLRLGWMADLLSKPVLTGFLAGIAVHIVLSQAPTLLGLPEESGDVYHRLTLLTQAMGATQPAALAIGIGVFGLIVGLEKLSPRLPGALIALLLSIWLTWLLKLQSHGVAVIGSLGSGVPTFGAPAFTLRAAASLVSLAVVTALVVMVQTAATTRAFPDANDDPDVNRDYIGIGAASIFAGLVGAFPVNASPPRTSAVVEAGGRTQLGGLAAAALVAALALWGGGLLAAVPKAALGGVLLFVAQRIFRVQVFAALARRTRGEFALAALTTALIVVLPIQAGVTIGIFLSLAHGMFTTTRTHLILFEHQPGGTVWWPVTPDRPGETLPGVVVVGFQAPLSFLNAYEFRRNLLMALDRASPPARLCVLEAGSIVEIDFTASEVLLQVIDAARRRGVNMAVARLESVRAQASQTPAPLPSVTTVPRRSGRESSS